MEKNNSKKPDKATVIGASAGIVGGVAAGLGAAALWPAQAAETDPPVVKSDPSGGEAEVVNTEVRYVNVVHHDKPAATNEPEVVVKEYNQVYDNNGNHIADVAVVNINGENITFVDSNLDGFADEVYHDANHNGIVDAGEVLPVNDQSFHMGSLRDSALAVNNIRLDEFADTDMADVTADVSGLDYVNDAHDLNSDDASGDMPADAQASVDGGDMGFTADIPDYAGYDAQDMSMTDPMGGDAGMPDYINDADVDGFIG